MSLPNQAESSVPGETAAGETRFPKSIGDLHKTITMAQIAKAAGVSQGAISSLLNDRDYGIRVSEKTRERVFKVCRELGYIPNDLRAVVRMYPELGDSCLIISTRFAGGLANPFVARVAAAAIGAVGAGARSLTLSFYDDAHDYAGDAENLPHPVRCGVCSKFLCLGEPNPSLFQALHRRGSPCVNLGSDAPHPAVFSFVPDYAKGSRLAIEHLHRLGHRQIAIVSGPFGATDPQIIDLNHGVQLACAELGLGLDPQRIIYGDLSEKAGRAALDELFQRQPEPTAIFCLSDAAAAGVIAAANARGLKVPGQLSVIGCSDDACAQFTLPALTTLHLPAEEMGTQGMVEIERLVREPLFAEPRKAILQVGLVQRASAGPVKAREK